MKTLTLVRHAKASRNKPGLQDHERPLSKRGEQDAPVMGRRLAEAGISPALIVSSPAIRAWTTADIIADALGLDDAALHTHNSLYMASVDDILNVIVAQDESVDSLMIVAHNPGLTDFANYLSPGVTNNLPSAGIVVVNFDQHDWDLYIRPATELVIYDFPNNYPNQ